MTLWRRGRSVFVRTLVRRLVSISLIARAAPVGGTGAEDTIDIFPGSRASVHRERLERKVRTRCSPDVRRGARSGLALRGELRGIGGRIAHQYRLVVQPLHQEIEKAPHLDREMSTGRIDRLDRDLAGVVIRQKPHQETLLQILGGQDRRQEADALARQRRAPQRFEAVAAQVAGYVDRDRALAAGEAPMVLDPGVDQAIVIGEILRPLRSAAARQIVRRGARYELADAEP